MYKRINVLFLIAVFVMSSAIVIQAANTTPAQLVSGARAAINEVNVQDAKKMFDSQDKVIFLDIRDPAEYEAEHLTGAIHMSRGLVDLHGNEILLDKNATIVVY